MAAGNYLWFSWNYLRILLQPENLYDSNAPSWFQSMNDSRIHLECKWICYRYRNTFYSLFFKSAERCQKETWTYGRRIKSGPLSRREFILCSLFWSSESHTQTWEKVCRILTRLIVNTECFIFIFIFFLIRNVLFSPTKNFKASLFLPDVQTFRK